MKDLIWDIVKEECGVKQYILLKMQVTVNGTAFQPVNVAKCFMQE